MYVQSIVVLVLLHSVGVSHATSPKATRLIESICDALDEKHGPRNSDDQKWESICQELFQSKRDGQNADELIQRILADQKTLDNTAEQRIRKRDASSIGKGRGGGGGGGRGGGSSSSGSRGGISSGSRGGSSGGSSSSGSRGGYGPSGARTSSASQYSSARTGSVLSRPVGYQWSRSRYVFLPVSTRYTYQSESSSNRFTTPIVVISTYYYCTSNDNASMEIQCYAGDRVTDCCEDETTQQPYCCGGEIPDDIKEIANRAAQAVARIFYALSALAFCVHVFVRLAYRS